MRFMPGCAVSENLIETLTKEGGSSDSGAEAEQTFKVKIKEETAAAAAKPTSAAIAENSGKDETVAGK